MAEPEAAQSPSSPQSTPSTVSTRSTPEAPPSTLPAPPLTNPWRGLLTLSLGVTLCVLAIAESTDEASAPTWFLGFAIPVLTEWIGEWLAYWRKKGEV